MLSGAFRAAYARIHLAAEKTNGLCSNLCDSTDDHASGRQQEFRKLIAKLKANKEEKARKRKQQEMRLAQREIDAAIEAHAAKRKKMKQPKLPQFMRLNDGAAADLAVAQWAIAHDISANAMKGPYWKHMNSKLSNTSPSYVAMNPQKVMATMFPQLKDMADKEIQSHLHHRQDIGRTLTGDGATKKVCMHNIHACIMYTHA